MARRPSQTDGVLRPRWSLYRREDYRADSVTVRMVTYERSTAPLIDSYENLGFLQPWRQPARPRKYARVR